ncbi:MAG TPA: alpha-amylase family glycosyl hydrolase [Anaerolineales bacterium]
MLISRRARDRYQFDADLLLPEGRLRVEDYAAARRAAAKLSAQRADPVPASDIYALSLLDEVLRILLREYSLQNPGVVSRAAGHVRASLGARLDELLARFLEEFPPLTVYRGEVPAGAYLQSRGAALHERITEDLLLNKIANDNPALRPYKELFDDALLKADTSYMEALALLSDFFARQPAFGARPAGAGGTLLEILSEPAKVSPDSLEGQLQFIIQKWGFLLGEALLQRLLRGLDFIREDVMRRHAPGGPPAPLPVPDYGGESEYERYSQDKDWMPQLVLMARNTYVWLEQLSRKHQRWIKTLDQIPDEELDLLAQRGFSGLWLIGLWERSRASQRIKQRMGQADAVASAYSLYSYDIAADLGGWGALQDLRSRAWSRGLRLSADMVPNHMGIDSAWVSEHPDWFLSLRQPPYPGYAFNSEDLSDDPHVGIVLEDHYYNHSDAAVVFKRFERGSGDTRYVYHGNDGTSFPWNDTAQLDYTSAEVREAVIQTILHVARNFPVIRFDAAMTLAKKHIQRLWFPEPGAGGAIPSRAEHGMTRAAFDAKVPNEFWREVVDRVAAEVPDTLLLAEAFWMMEGYFVRTLGMHRVYNSAFMHMLRDEDNAKYRLAIKNTLEFDPQILKRYVNFMNNPDEKTAIEQFGDGDKYFGVCVLLATLPGLPMFGHGQIEGYREKYGMEFRKPKLDEAPNEALIRGHEWKIFPLLQRRRLFAEVEHFRLYDLFRADGRVDENVFAFSNRSDGDPSTGPGQVGLVIHHNKFADTRGWLKTSAAFLDKGAGRLKQTPLAEALGLPSEGHVIFKDYVTHLEYVRSCKSLWEQGLHVELAAYQHHAFMDWRIVDDSRWASVDSALNGAGVESMQAKWDELFGDRKEERETKPRKVAAARKRATSKKTAAGTSAPAKKPSPPKKPAAPNKPVVKKAKASTPKRPAVTKVLAKKKSVPAKKAAAKKTGAVKKATRKA